jgi:chemotaxis protein CheD
MKTQEFLLDVFLQPGELYFGDYNTRIRTILGSCVAITLWHPQLRIGGMCHYLLASKRQQPGSEPDGRYADDVMKIFMTELNRTATSPAQYVVKMFGGGNQFPGKHKPASTSVPDNNILAGRKLLKDYGFEIKAEHLGGTGHRNVIFDLSNGHVWIRHVAIEVQNE